MVDFETVRQALPLHSAECSLAALREVVRRGLTDAPRAKRVALQREVCTCYRAALDRIEAEVKRLRAIEEAAREWLADENGVGFTNGATALRAALTQEDE